MRALLILLVCCGVTPFAAAEVIFPPLDETLIHEWVDSQLQAGREVSMHVFWGQNTNPDYGPCSPMQNPVGCDHLLDVEETVQVTDVEQFTVELFASGEPTGFFYTENVWTLVDESDTQLTAIFDKEIVMPGVKSHKIRPHSPGDRSTRPPCRCRPTSATPTTPWAG